MIIDNFNIEINKENVFKILDIKENTEAYKEASIIFENMKEIFYKSSNPLCLYELKNKKIENCNFSIFVLMSVGKNIENVINDFFSKGEYFNGILLNGICDNFLMQIDRTAVNEISDFICSKKLCIVKRFYPHENIEASAMKKITENLNSKKYGITVNDSYILTPAKSIGFIFGADFYDDNINNINNIIHNCLNCNNKNCRWRTTNA